MKIALGADHAGYELKNEIARHLRRLGHQVEDLGTNSPDSVDYPDYAKDVGRKVARGVAERGILVCGTGQGMCMTANKIPGVRAGVVSDLFSAQMIRAHNDANVLCLGARVTPPEKVREIVEAFLSTAFEGGRHERRVGKIEK
ncbi:MAG: ribose 5-phosphate isomerase B [Bdellovibrionota bacterium]